VGDLKHTATAHDSVRVMSNPDCCNSLKAASASARKFFIATRLLLLVIMFVLSISAFCAFRKVKMKPDAAVCHGVLFYGVFTAE
jgi:hypothetical protein